jgi:hypothetical protein
MVPQRHVNFEEDIMKNKFYRYVLALGFATLLTSGGLSVSKAYGDIIITDFESGITLQTLADSWTDSDPNNNIVLQVGDKLFGEFYASSVGDSPVPLDGVIVTPRIDLNGEYGHTEYGLSFQMPADNTAYAGESKDLLLGFSVTTTFGDDRIIDDVLTFTGYTEGSGIIRIGELVLDENNNLISQLGVWIDPNLPFDRIVDSDLFDPQDILRIRKDISWSADNCLDSSPCIDHAYLSDFTQMFSQIETPRIPEPSSILLLGLGLAGLGIVRRKRSAK